MTCDCKKTIEEQLVEMFQAKATEATDHKVRLGGYTLILGEKLTQRGCMPMKLTAKHPLKKAASKKKRRRRI